MHPAVLPELLMLPRAGVAQTRSHIPPTGGAGVAQTLMSCAGARENWRNLLLLIERPHIDHALPRRRRRDAVRDEAENQAGDQAAEVRCVVDEGEAVADADVHDNPEEQLADQASRPRLISIQRRAADREDERAHDSEDRAARADGRTFVQDRAR